MSQKGFSKPQTRGLASGWGTSWILVIVVVVAAAGVLIWHQLQAPTEEEQPSVEEAELPQEEVQPPTDETADWKTYRNEEYGFEVDYPKIGWKFEKYSLKEPSFFTLCKELSKEEKKELTSEFIEFTCVSARILFLDSKCTDFDWDKAIKEDPPRKVYDCVIQAAMTFKHRGEILTESKEKGYRGWGAQDSAGEEPLEFVFFPLKEIKKQEGVSKPILWIFYSIHAPEEIEGVFSQMLATFKSID